MQQALMDCSREEYELEMQNKELRRAQEELFEIQGQYLELYDFAPVGYITVSEKGLILQSNLTFASMLGIPRSQLINQPLSAFIFEEEQDIYYQNRLRTLEQREVQSCELRLHNQLGDSFWVGLDSICIETPNGEFNRIQLALSNISERKQAEEALRRTRDGLETRVQERTTELVEINREPAREVARSGSSRAICRILLRFFSPPEKPMGCWACHTHKSPNENPTASNGASRTWSSSFRVASNSHCPSLSS